jgi:aldehyde:ferredoxin oxidoreductase
VKPSEDTLPSRLLDEPLEATGASMSHAELEQMVKAYHALRQW